MIKEIILDIFDQLNDDEYAILTFDGEFIGARGPTKNFFYENFEEINDLMRMKLKADVNTQNSAWIWVLEKNLKNAEPLLLPRHINLLFEIFLDDDEEI